MSAFIEGGSLTARRDAISRDYTVAFSMGPVQRGDTSGGLYNRVWCVREEDGEVFISRANDDNSAFEEETSLFTYEGAAIDDLDLGFDTNGAAVVSAQRPTGALGVAEVWLFWFDVRIPGNVFSVVSAGRTPRLILDDPSGSVADLLLFYLNDVTQRVEIRIQSENYEVASLLPVDKWFDLETGLGVLQTNTINLYLEDVAKASDYRLHVIASWRDSVEGTYRLIVAESAPYPIPFEEELSTVDRVRSLLLTEVLLLLSFDNLLGEIHGVASLDLIDLLLQTNLDHSSLNTLDRIVSLALIDLLLQDTTDAETLSALHRISSLLLTTTVLTTTATAETQSHVHEVKSLTLSAA